MSARIPSLVALLVVAAAAGLCGQSIQPLTIDADGYPTVRAMFWGVDASGEKIEPPAAQVAVWENGVRQTVLDVTCRTPQPQPSVSVAIGIVTNSSGARFVLDGATSLDLAKFGAHHLVDILDRDSSRIALAVYGHVSGVRSYFTANRHWLAELIDSIPIDKYDRPRDGRRWLLDSAYGLLNVARLGTGRRIAFLFDNDIELPAFSKADFQEALDTCRRYGIVFCTVHEGWGQVHASPWFAMLADSTGGRTFYGITGTMQLQAALNEWLFRLRGDEPCVITWRSGNACNATGRAVDIAVAGVHDTLHSSYGVAREQSGRLDVAPRTLAFGDVRTGGGRDLTAYMIASAPTVVGSIASSDPRFSIVSMQPPLPARLAAGDSLRIVVRCSPGDTAFASARLLIATDRCDDSIRLSAGAAASWITPSTLRIISPVPGDTLHSGDTIAIRWTTTSADDIFYVGWSDDAGASWRFVGDRVPGDSLRWVVPSVHGGIRLWVSNTSNSQLAVLYYPTQSNVPYGLGWISDGRSMVVSSASAKPAFEELSVVRVPDITTIGGDYNYLTGRPIAGAADPVHPRLLYVSDRTAIILDSDAVAVRKTPVADDVNRVTWDRFGRRAAFLSNRWHATIWDADSARYASQLPRCRYQDSIRTMEWSADTSMIALGLWPAHPDAPGIGVAALPGGAVTATIPSIAPFAWSSDARTIATLESTQVVAWDAGSGVQIDRLSASGLHPTAFAWHPDGERIAVGAHDSLVRVWHVGHGMQELLAPRGRLDTDYVTALAWSPDGSLLAIGWTDGAISVVDAQSGRLIRQNWLLRSGVAAIAWQPAGRALIAYPTRCTGQGPDCWDQIVGLLRVDLAWDYMDVDTSHADITVRGTALEIFNVECGVVKPGTRKSMMCTLARNPNNYPIRVDHIEYGSVYADKFAVMDSNLPMLLLPGDSLRVLLSFGPEYAQHYNADFRIVGDHLLQFVHLHGLGGIPASIGTDDRPRSPGDTDHQAHAPASTLRAVLAPNPAAEHTVIDYDVDSCAVVAIDVVGVLGARLRRFEPGMQCGGRHHVAIDLDDLPPEPCFVVLTIGARQQVLPLIVAGR